MQALAGFFAVGAILEDTPANLWTKCAPHAGVTKPDFFRHFQGKARGYAITIAAVHPFARPVDPRAVFPGFHPPQSFCYVDAPDPRALFTELLDCIN